MMVDNAAADDECFKWVAMGQ